MFQRMACGLRSGTNISRSIWAHRLLTCTASTRSDIHSEILDILREETIESGDNSTTAPKKKRGILILSPEKTKNKDYARYMASLAQKNTRATKNKVQPGKSPSSRLPDLSAELNGAAKSEDSKGDAIDDFRNGKPTPVLARDLCGAFTRAQLAAYVTKHVPAVYRKSHTKLQLATAIVDQVWGEKEVMGHEIVRQERIPLTHQEMFLLLSQRGAMLRVLQATVTRLDFDGSRRELVLMGTEGQLQNAQINLTHRFENARREVVDLAAVKALYEEKYGSFVLDKIGRLIEVYFLHMHDGTYELCALDRGQVKRIKRLLVWFLDYNLHSSSGVFLPEKTTLDTANLVPVADDYALVWHERPNAYFRLVDATHPPHVQSHILRELSKFSAASIDRAASGSDYDVLPRDFYTSSAMDETYETLTGSGLLGSETIEDVVEDLVVNNRENDELESDSKSSLNPSQVFLISPQKMDQLYSELTDFKYREGLPGVDTDKLDPPVFTVTLGRVLFQQEKSPGQALAPPPLKPALSASSPYTFTSNVPQVYDKVLHEGFADMDVESVNGDPHTYSLQFRFLPSPYAETPENGTWHQNMKYPPVEMWMQLNDNKVVDIESMQLVTVEGENDRHVCLPTHACDIKVSCQKTGRVISDDTEIDPESINSPDSLDSTDPLGSIDSSDSLDGLFEATSGKYPKLRSQPGVQRFLEDLKLNFSGKSATSIQPFMDVEISGKTVRYEFVSVNYRRELDVEIGDGQMAQVSIVDGGLLGGRRAEVRFIGDLSQGTSRPAFDALIDATAKFVDDL